MNNAAMIRKANVRAKNGLAVELSCPLDALEENVPTVKKADLKLRTVELNFTFEFTIKDPVEPEDEVWYQDVPVLELDILYEVAKSTGLYECDFQRQSLYLWDGETSNFDGPFLLSLSSMPADVRDDLVEGCQHITNVQVGLICIPVQGTMTASYAARSVGDEAVEKYITQHIENVMPELRTSSVQEVKLFRDVGGRGEPDASQSGTSAIREAENKSSESRKTWSTSLTLSLSFIVVTVLVVALITRRQKRPRSDSTSEVVIESHRKNAEVAIRDDNSVKHVLTRLDSRSQNTEPDVENQPTVSLTSTMTTLPSLTPLTSSAITLPTSNVTSQQQQRLSQKAASSATQSMPKKDKALADEISQDILVDTAAVLSDLSSLAEEMSSTFVVNGNTTSSDETGSPSGSHVDLPPKPPVSTSAKPPSGPSKSIKAVRKKKKKKKQKIIRVGSRENIVEMETITEEKEEEKASDGDCSEYSWCSTDDDDSTRGSRDPSPARSNSGSRDLSPSTRSRGSGGSSSNLISSSSSFEELR